MRSQSIYEFYKDKIFGDHDDDFDFYRSHCSSWFIVEIIILLICPIPYFEWFVPIKYYIKNSKLE